MKIIGITGGIGSGKTTVSNMIREMGFPVFDCDLVAKTVSDTDPDVINDIKLNFGDDIYQNDRLDRKSLAKIVFSDKDSLEVLNGIIHPKTREKMYDAIDKSDSDLFFVESAILYDSGLDKDMDEVIATTTALNTRVNRVMKRDGVTKESVLKRIENQMSEYDLLTNVDHIILTDFELKDIKEDVVLVIEMINCIL